MKLSSQQLKLIIQEELNILENEEEEFDTNVTSEQFSHLKAFMEYDILQGLAMIDAKIGVDEISEEEKEELLKIVWYKTVTYKETSKYKELEAGLKKAKETWDWDSERSYKSELADIYRNQLEVLDILGEMLGLGEDAYYTILNDPRFLNFKYFRHLFKKKGIM